MQWETTVGAILAKKLKRELIDLDSFIENIAGKRIHDFFKTGGEPEFRRAETQLLKFIIYRYKKHTSQHDNGLIVATGGGIVTSKRNRYILNSMCKCVYLSLPSDVLVARYKKSFYRPML